MFLLLESASTDILMRYAYTFRSLFIGELRLTYLFGVITICEEQGGLYLVMTPMAHY